MFDPGIMPAVEALSRKFETLACVLDERTRRLVAAAEASAIGHGGVTLVAAASGLSRGTVMRGVAELRTASRPERSQPIRRKGAGRKRTVDQDATLKRDLEALVEPATGGHPETPLRWTCKSVRQLAVELRRMGHQTTSPSFPWTRRRKNGWVSSGTTGANCGRRAIRSRCGCTIF
jgi:hypothetical protein